MRETHTHNIKQQPIPTTSTLLQLLQLLWTTKNTIHWYKWLYVWRWFVVASFNLWMHNCYLNSFKFWYYWCLRLAFVRVRSIDLNLKAWKIQQFNTFYIHNKIYILILSKTTSGVQCHAEQPACNLSAPKMNITHIFYCRCLL